MKLNEKREYLIWHGGTFTGRTYPVTDPSPTSLRVRAERLTAELHATQPELKPVQPFIFRTARYLFGINQLPLPMQCLHHDKFTFGRIALLVFALELLRGFIYGGL